MPPIIRSGGIKMGTYLYIFIYIYNYVYDNINVYNLMCYLLELLVSSFEHVFLFQCFNFDKTTTYNSITIIST